MIRTNFLDGSPIREVKPAVKNKYHVVEYERDFSVSPDEAEEAYFASQMNFRKRQLSVELNDDAVVTQSGSVQWFTGNVDASTNVKGAGDLAGKIFNSSVTKESAIKPRYRGTGIVCLEPTYKYLLIEDLSDWNGGMVIEDGLFLACDEAIQIKTVARSNISSAMLGREGIFNTCLIGNGAIVLESPVPQEELITVDLHDDALKINGPYAIAWSNSLEFTVERTTKTLIGSAASGEGLVNVYRGTGRVLMSPVEYCIDEPDSKGNGKR